MKLGALNYGAGEGRIRFAAGWDDIDGVLRLDVLKDWARLLQQEYARVHRQEYPGLLDAREREEQHGERET